jgi:hypothetical protein
MALLMTGLAGCGHNVDPAQLGPAVPVQTAQQDQQQALRFEVIPNAVHKVDIIRQTHSESYDCGTPERPDTCTREVEDPLQPVGVYLGNGLFLDAGLNLSMVPDRAFHGPVIPQKFERMEIRGPLGDWSRSTLVQQGNQVSIGERFSIFDHRVVHESPQKTRLELGTFSALQKFSTIQITRQGDTTTIQGWSLPGMSALNRVEIRQNGDTTTVHPFGPGVLVDTHITRQGQTITVQPFGGGLSRTTIARQADGSIRVSNPLGLSGTTVTRGENGVNTSSLGLSFGKSSILRQADGNYTIRQPGIFTTTTVAVNP